MKKYLIFFIVFLLSCSSDDSNIGNPIQNPEFNVDLLIKRWSYNQVNINGQQYIYQHQPSCQKDEFTFANNETQIRQYSELIFINDICSTNGINMDWRVKNDIISLFFGSQKVIDFKVILVNENSFIYSYVYDIDNDNIDDNIIIYAIPYE